MRLFLAALLTCCIIQPAGASEVIHSFDAHIAVQADSSLIVSEKISARAEHAEIKHGIYRDLPQVRRTRLGGWVATEYRIISIKQDGVPAQYHTGHNGDMLRIYIGSANEETPVGDHNYVLSYEVKDQIRYFGDHDELTWNVTGNGWAFPIEKATASVSLPGDVLIKGVDVVTGRLAAHGHDAKVEFNGSTASFVTTRPLSSGQGMTVSLRWPKGYVAEPPQLSPFAFFMHSQPGLPEILAIFLLMGLYYLMSWNKVGRDPKGKSLAPFYDPPKNVSPAMAAQILEQGLADSPCCFTAAIISLAAKGFITIDELEKKTYIIKRTTKPVDQNLPKDEGVALSGLTGETVVKPGSGTLSLLMLRHAMAVRGACKGTYYQTNSSVWAIGLIIPVIFFGYMFWHLQDRMMPIGMAFIMSAISCAAIFSAIIRFRSIKGNVFLRALPLAFAMLSTIAIGIGVIIGMTSTMPVSFLVVLLAVLSGIILSVFFYILRAPTKLGRDVMNELQGLRYYMSVVEEKVLLKFNPPEMSRELYEKYLPYACALGVDSKWGDKFALSVAGAAVAATAVHSSMAPSWYHSSSMSSGGFSLSSFTSGITSSVASSSGGSGGGGGGGGGGGW